MSPSATALAIIVAIALLGSGLGFYAGSRQKMNLEQWTVGSRGFGTLLMWLLMAGEGYTTFSVLGASGWVYSRGGPALYIPAYITLSNVAAFFLLPAIWELGRTHGLQTEPDFFRVRYGTGMRAHHVVWRGRAGWTQSAEDAAYYRRHPIS